MRTLLGVGVRENFYPGLVFYGIDFRVPPSVPPDHRCGFGVTNRATPSPPYHQTLNPGYTFISPLERVDSHQMERSQVLIVVATRGCGFLNLCPVPASYPKLRIGWLKLPRSFPRIMCLGITGVWIFLDVCSPLERWGVRV